MHKILLHRDAFGRLVLTDAQGLEHAGVVPVRAFPLTAPAGGIAVVDVDGRELLWLDALDDVDADGRALLEQELALREFRPQITRIDAVSSFATPSTWTVQTTRGATELVLKAEEDIRRVGGARLLIADSHGLQFEVADVAALDRHSRRLLDRFL
mgnify:CR=1 FL=1